MSRRADDLTHHDYGAACAFAAFIGGLAGGLVAALLMSGVMMLGGSV